MRARGLRSRLHRVVVAHGLPFRARSRGERTKPSCGRSQPSSRICRVSTTPPMSPHLTEATVRVDCGDPRGPLRRIWTSFGFDEINWTSMPAGKRHLRTIAAFAEQPYYVRSHYIFNSGIGWSLPHWGAGNVYHEDASGRPFHDFSIADQVYDAVVHAGHRPLVELAFTPRALVPDGAEKTFPFEPSPAQWSPYEAGLWAMPPKDYQKWGGLVRALVEHCVARYGAA